MVREVRLAWDDAEGLDRLSVRDRFEPLEDESLDVVLTTERPAPNGTAGERPSPKPRDRQSGGRARLRHLAGADHLGEGYLPTKRRAAVRT